MDPIATSEAIVGTYRRYLGSLLPLRDPALAAELDRQLAAASSVVNGPLVEMTPPFVHGVSLQALVDEGVLTKGLHTVFSEALPGSRLLYRHQEDAIRRAAQGRNLIVATGTGSGKTESFLVPILDALVREREAGTLGPGVRALLLYPMNALANDQLKRMREVLKGSPDITFGRYTGETLQDPAKAREKYRSKHGVDPLPNEIISRTEMQERPPHILLTNYAMLEYLLLRPRDLALFGGEHGGNWKFVVVDEAHVYDGIKGAEIAMLLRRLRERVARDQPIQFLASSATVGKDEAKVAEFGRSLFGVPFEWSTNDPSRRDVVTATRRQISDGDSWGPLSPEQLASLSVAEVPEDAIRQIGSGALADEVSMRTLQRKLSDGPQSLSDLARVVFPDESAHVRERALVDLVAAGHRVLGAGGAPVLSARYHLFVSAVEGAFACMSATGPHVRLSRHAECPDCAAPMFELAACKRCGQLHFPGHVNRTDGREVFSPKVKDGGTTHWVLLGDHAVPADEDDDAHEGEVSVGESLDATLCTGCGTFGAQDAASCAACGATSVRKVQRIDGGRDLTSCRSCGGRSARQIRRFGSGGDATAAVIATALYAHVPTDPTVSLPGDGRRLLMFSDSRQQAAFAAPYLQLTYAALLQRSLITQALKSESGEDLSSSDLAQITRRHAEKAGVFAYGASAFAKRMDVALWLHREMIEGDERTSLEGTVLASVRFRRPRSAPPAPLLKLGLTADEGWDVLDQLVQTLRIQGAVAPIEDNVDLASELLSPRNRAVYVRESQSDAKRSILSWSPTARGGRNRRLDYVSRVLAQLGSSQDPLEFLASVWEFLKHPQAGPGWLTHVNDGRNGIMWRVDPETLQWRYLEDGDSIWRCDLCRRPTVRSVRGVCPTNACDGRLVAESVRHATDDHYAQTYQTMDVAPLRAEEHTAQLSADTASGIQEEFLSGQVNVLSCSTTFEMGVDVGELQSVLLRNVPPTTANYVQRAGRAGRRTESAALVVTFAQMRSHDQSMFQRPENMISGTMRAPVVVDDNPRVDRRHAHSIALAAFFRDTYDTTGREFRNVSSFYGGEEPTGETLLKGYLSALPDRVARAVRDVLPSTVHDETGVTDGSWALGLADLVGQAGVEYLADIEHFQSRLDEDAAAKRFDSAKTLQRVISTIEDRQLFAYFSRRNILPKYGFPVDTVELRVAGDADSHASNLDLSRDLAMAINEYAPGSAIIAQGKIIESAGVYRLPHKELVQRDYAVCQVCEQLEVSNDELGGTCVCGAQREGSRRRFVKPEFGFVASRTIRPVGTSRPVSRWLSRQYLLNEGEVTAVAESNTGLGRIRSRLSVRATMCVLNEGLSRSRFLICDWCGFSTGGHVAAASKKAKSHIRPLTGKDCTGHMRSLALAHDYETDVLVLEVPTLGSVEQARSVLYGLLAGACDVLEISRDDIDGTVIPSQGNALVLFDTVPAGAGLVRRIADEIHKVVEAMRDRVGACDCGLETSCYRCLRVYRNQAFHDELRRDLVLEVLDRGGVATQGTEGLGRARDAEGPVAQVVGPAHHEKGWSSLLAGSSELEMTVIAALEGFELPVPVVGHEVDGIPIAFSWPGQRVALDVDLDPDARTALLASGWKVITVDPGTVGDALSITADA